VDRWVVDRPSVTTPGGPQTPGTVDLYWIPLGAGAKVVRVSGRIFEAISAFVRRRARCDLYHSALVVDVAEGHYVIEQARSPMPTGDAGESWPRVRSEFVGGPLPDLPVRGATLARRTDP